MGVFKMFPVQAAVQAARQFITATFGSENVQGLRLEEVELSQDELTWYVTLSFVRGDAPGALATSMGLTSAGREYKIVALRASDGEAQSVKIRELAHSL
jgi:hypothetical protein